MLRTCNRAYRSTVALRDYRLDAIPEIGLSEILGDRHAKIQLTVMPYEDGMMPSNEAMILLSILAAESPQEVLEIGTFMGHTTRAMAENLPNSKIHTVDLPLDYKPDTSAARQVPMDDFHLIEQRVVGREFQNEQVRNRIVQHYANTANWDFSAAGHPNFIFIDGSHTYEHCKNDSEKCLEIASAAAVFLWHDCDGRHPGVTRFIMDWRKLGRDVRRVSGTSLAYWKRP
jgi:predicted O-methyltransferase YrrM